MSLYKKFFHLLDIFMKGLFYILILNYAHSQCDFWNKSVKLCTCNKLSNKCGRLVCFWDITGVDSGHCRTKASMNFKISLSFQNAKRTV